MGCVQVTELLAKVDPQHSAKVASSFQPYLISVGGRFVRFARLHWELRWDTGPLARALSRLMTSRSGEQQQSEFAHPPSSLLYRIG